MAKKKTKKILTIDGDAITGDAERIETLRQSMTPCDRENYDKICKAIEISLETGRLSVFPQLIKQKEEIERRYEQTDDDRINVVWDEMALSEAANG